MPSPLSPHTQSLPPRSPSVKSVRTTATHTSSLGTVESEDIQTVASSIGTCIGTQHSHSQTHSPARPTHAQRGIRHQASFHTIQQFMPPHHQSTSTSAPLDLDLDMAMGTGTGTGTGVEAGSGSGGTDGPGLSRQPSFSFLTSDPNQAPSSSSHATFSTLSRQSSSASIGSQFQSQMQVQSPSRFTDTMVSGTPNANSNRLSGMTARSGMADIASSSHSDSNPNPSPGTGSNGSFPSAMAVHSPLPVLTHVPSASSSTSRKARPARPTRPTQTQTPTPSNSISSRTRKRISNSTIHRRSFQRKYGKWELDIEMSSPLLPGSELDRRRREREEEELELAALLGRATVLERMLRAGKRVSGTSLPILKLASRPSTKTSTSHTSEPRPSLSISIRSVRRHLSRRLKLLNEDEFTDLDSQSGFGSIPPIEVVLTERERGWVVLLPEPQDSSKEPSPTSGPPPPEKDCLRSPMCLSLGSPLRIASPPAPTADDEEKGRRIHPQSPHLGHRSPDYHQRQSVFSYISVGRWSNSTQGSKRRRLWIVGITVTSIVSVIILTGVLAGVLSKRKEE